MVICISVKMVVLVVLAVVLVIHVILVHMIIIHITAKVVVLNPRGVYVLRLLL